MGNERVMTGHMRHLSSPCHGHQRNNLMPTQYLRMRPEGRLASVPYPKKPLGLISGKKVKVNKRNFGPY